MVNVAMTAFDPDGEVPVVRLKLKSFALPVRMTGAPPVPAPVDVATDTFDPASMTCPVFAIENTVAVDVEMENRPVGVNDPIPRAPISVFCPDPNPLKVEPSTSPFTSR